MGLILIGFFSTSFALTSLLHGKATGPNVTMNFDDDYSNVWVIVDQFKDNVCGTNYPGFLLTWHVNREGNGYVYFNEDDWDNSVNTCVAIILSGGKFYLTGVGKTDSWEGYKMFFDDIKLNWNNTDKKYYFSGEAVDDALGVVDNWTGVSVSGLNLIDWSKTIVDYSWLTGGTLYANGTSGTLNIILKDVSGLEVKTIDYITGEIISSNITGYVFFDTGASVKKKFSVNDGIVSIPLYILKAVSNGEITIKFEYSIPDIDGNYSHEITLKNINIQNPVKDIYPVISDNLIVWNTWGVNILTSYYSTGLISSYEILPLTVITDSKYRLVSSSLSWNILSLKIVPNNPDDTLSVVDVTGTISEIKLKFNEFWWKEVLYNINRSIFLHAYADKRVDYNKSFTWLVLSTIYTWGDVTNTLTFYPVLRDKNWYRIPDVKFDIKIKDAWVADSYTGWDCNELEAGYQTTCKALQFMLWDKIYSGSIGSVLWSSFSYISTWSVYTGIKVISYKPVTWWTLEFNISNIQNISTWWDFKNSGDYIKLDSYSGYIKNIVFKPFLQLRLQWLDDEENYVDINNTILLKFANFSSYPITNFSYDLTGQITYPSIWVDFVTGKVLTWENLAINANSVIYNDLNVLFKLDYTFDDNIKFNYNHGFYTYTLGNWIWSLVLRPRDFYFNLWGTYKIWGAFIDGIVNTVQKYSANVKTTLGRRQPAISVKFVNIYNQLRKKVNYLLQGVKPESSNSIDVNNLDGGLKYYTCGNNGYLVTVNGGSYKGNNLIVLRNCKLLIKGNIYKSDNKSTLVFFLFDDKTADLSSPLYLDRISNIYIAENVSDIEAWLFTKGSIFTIDGDNPTDSSIYMVNRSTHINDKQLYIKGSLMAKNNVGGSFLIEGENKFTIGASKKINPNMMFWGKHSPVELRNIAQIFDINFWRGFKYSWNNSIDPNWYSTHCNSTVRTKEVWCKYPVYIQYDSSIKNNILFK